MLRERDMMRTSSIPANVLNNITEIKFFSGARPLQSGAVTAGRVGLQHNFSCQFLKE
jgi:hypothetical protein